MMALYQRFKAEHPEALLFFRLGDFYEMFGDDAKEGAALLDITLTARSAGEGRAVKIPMCGVPYHAAETYINRLLKLGRKVAIVEQMEDPRRAKGMVKRELVRIITPGTILEPNSLEAKENNYLAAVVLHNGVIGLSAADLSTGEFLAAEFPGERGWEDLLIEMGRLRPSEILVPDDLAQEFSERLGRQDGAYLTRLEGYRFDADAGRAQLLEHFKVPSLEGFGCGDFTLALGAAGAVLYYLADTQRGSLAHLRKLTPYALKTTMVLDQATVRNLDLVRNAIDGTRKNTLLETLDYTLTAMGARRLLRWILRPLLAVDAIAQRQAAVAELGAVARRRQELQSRLGRVHDLERLAGRVGSCTAHARDLTALDSTLDLLPGIQQTLAEFQAEKLAQLASALPVCSELHGLLTAALAPEPPLSLREGGLIRDGYHAEVDELRGLSREGKGFIASLQARERERTGIASLKVEYNSVFGYYLEVSRANAKLVPADYIRKQTLVNAERYITPELKDYEQKVMGAEDRLQELEYELFIQLRSRVADHLPELLLAADLIADLDVLLSLTEAAARYEYVRPQVDDGETLEISQGRHPVVERLTSEKFIPNDLVLNNTESQIMILTGPNMAGKSTYLRQSALIVIMAQMGGFVPVAEARLGIVDRIFTRVGAADNLAGGQSTFMVEMNETANILHNATSRSLVILDEVGRGTSTFDGVSIAWAVAEYLHDRIGAKTLFATHYYELTELALSKPRVKNFNILVREWKDKIIFLRKIVSGSTDRSYGIQVARLAGLPEEAITRAQEVLANLERANYTDAGKSRLAEHGPDPGTPQMSLFGMAAGAELMQELQALDPDHLTPLAALARLAELRKKYFGG
jgi:DNA mismatch repair protein MutS